MHSRVGDGDAEVRRAALAASEPELYAPEQVREATVAQAAVGPRREPARSCRSPRGVEERTAVHVARPASEPRSGFRYFDPLPIPRASTASAPPLRAIDPKGHGTMETPTRKLGDLTMAELLVDADRELSGLSNRLTALGVDDLIVSAHIGGVSARVKIACDRLGVKPWREIDGPHADGLAWAKGDDGAAKRTNEAA
jgi:hypothetical protein